MNRSARILLIMRILGIETSCDETAAAVVVNGRYILSNVVASQDEIHAEYGGIFPEVASRVHIETIVPVIREALERADTAWDEIDGLAVTYGPGLAGSLLVGVNTGKALALTHDLPYLGINHLEAHVYSNWLIIDGSQKEPSFPLLCLIVSGGHTELVLMADHLDYEVLGRTLDDAAGEAFDKVARLLGLGYPGGPAIQEAASGGSPTAIDFPRAWLPDTYDFSFSGLKTAVLREVQTFEKREEVLPVADIAASFQEAVVDVLVEKTIGAAEEYDVEDVLLSGGVSANKRLRELIVERLGEPVRYPPPWLCTDNAAMIAAAGYFRFRVSERSGWDLDVVPSLTLAR